MILKMHLGKGLKFSKNIILASNSSRRAEILHDLGINFEKKVIPTEEKTKAIGPRKMVLDIAYKKGIEVYKENKNSIVISADTIVYKDKVYKMMQHHRIRYYFCFLKPLYRFRFCKMGNYGADLRTNDGKPRSFTGFNTGCIPYRRFQHQYHHSADELFCNDCRLYEKV